VMCMTDRFWEALIETLGRTDLRVDPRFRSQQLRAQNRDVLTHALDSEFRKRSTEHWLSALRGVLPIAPVLDVRQALDNPFVTEAGMVSQVPHPLKPDMKLLSSPLKFDGVRPEQVACRALGADNPPDSALS
jgi:crotonobetainyl-CoA:carnitine CoA-transferase CaiB-like acyl-CoA transferase